MERERVSSSDPLTRICHKLTNCKYVYVLMLVTFQFLSQRSHFGTLSCLQLLLKGQSKRSVSFPSTFSETPSLHPVSSPLKDRLNFDFTMNKQASESRILYFTGAYTQKAIQPLDEHRYLIIDIWEELG
jgi:hypothetical protein